MTGAVVSFTRSVVEQTAVFPAASLTVIFMGVVPRPTRVPAAGLCVLTSASAGVQLSEQTSVPTTFGTAALPLALAEAVSGWGATTAGAVVSTTLKVAVAAPTLPAASVT